MTNLLSRYNDKTHDLKFISVDCEALEVRHHSENKIRSSGGDSYYQGDGKWGQTAVHVSSTTVNYTEVWINLYGKELPISLDSSFSVRQGNKLTLLLVEGKPNNENHEIWKVISVKNSQTGSYTQMVDSDSLASQFVPFEERKYPIKGTALLWLLGGPILAFIQCKLLENTSYQQLFNDIVVHTGEDMAQVVVFIISIYSDLFKQSSFDGVALGIAGWTAICVGIMRLLSDNRDEENRSKFSKFVSNLSNQFKNN
ncbi:hypothetical protein [Ferrimonas pelagia]|uniref:Uncharacterized protein n=1 Tax=Ferrimonas pelagia TaxID=1177826 RepID=A0ABP9F652_9GAMM